MVLGIEVNVYELQSSGTGEQRRLGEKWAYVSTMLFSRGWHKWFRSSPGDAGYGILVSPVTKLKSARISHLPGPTGRSLEL